MAPRQWFNLEDRVHRRMIRRWASAAGLAGQMPLSALRRLRGHAGALRAQVDRFLYVADGRLALPLMGSDRFHRPDGTDWAWRPTPWRGPLPQRGWAGVATGTALDPSVTLFHDCPLQEITLRQTRSNGDTEPAPFAVSLDVFGFAGSFLSLAIGLPQEGVAGTAKRHLVTLRGAIDTERPLEIFARLNMRFGPNTDQMVLELTRGGPDRTATFDLAYSKMDDRKLEAMWVDLIFEKPEMNRIVVRDLTLCRHPRAAL